MDKIISIIFLVLVIAAVIFLANLLVDALVILCKKLSKKIRLALGLSIKDEPKKDEQAADEAPSEEEKTKNNPNDILQKILAKRKNATSDVEDPVYDDTIVEVADYEIKE